MNSTQLHHLIDTIKRLSPEEKMQVNEALWEGDIEIPTEHQQIVLDRIKKVRKDPSRLKSWDEISKNLKFK